MDPLWGYLCPKQVLSMVPETKVSDEIAFWFKIYNIVDIQKFYIFQSLVDFSSLEGPKKDTTMDRSKKSRKYTIKQLCIRKPC